MQILNRSLATLILFATVSAVSAAPAVLDPPKRAEIPKRMQAFVDDATISGAVTLVAHHRRRFARAMGMRR